MDWIKADIYTNGEGIEPLTGRLMNIGVTGFEIVDSADFDEFLERKDGNWDYYDDSLDELKNAETTVSFYVPENAQGAEILKAALGQLSEMKELDEDFGRLVLVTDRHLKESDWENNWKQYFKPFTVGERLAVKPSWEEFSDPGRVILEIDPGSSFGTGQHNTTRLCLEFLDGLVKGGERVLDLGCGSGILGIAALLLGAESVTAVDIDENSTRIAGENFEKNALPPRSYTIHTGNILSDSGLAGRLGTGYDIITANIVADVLIGMAPMFRSFLKKGGTLIVSGIIDTRADDVRSALLDRGFTVKEERASENWLAISLE
ncbi:MAG: 50S ribosomal protein L11 methyltransferase [Oscillospiraceae bacterium]|nr:50S ribosomal protein L11 methyltransferase [Oscillospiraceae bacterium]